MTDESTMTCATCGDPSDSFLCRSCTRDVQDKVAADGLSTDEMYAHDLGAVIDDEIDDWLPGACPGGPTCGGGCPCVALPDKSKQ